MATSVTSAMSIPMLEKRSVCHANCCPGGSTAERWGKRTATSPPQGLMRRPAAAELGGGPRQERARRRDRARREGAGQASATRLTWE